MSGKNIQKTLLKETKYTIACVEPENYNFYKKYKFEFEKWEDKLCYFFVMIRKNF